MATDKKINYDMQGHKKPARNYLGKQKTVKNIPIKWKSGLKLFAKAFSSFISKRNLRLSPTPYRFISRLSVSLNGMVMAIIK